MKRQIISVIIVIVFIFISIFVCVQRGTSPNEEIIDPHKEIISIAELMHQAYEEEAKERLNVLLAKNPNNCDALFLQSLDSWYYGKLQKAIDYCSRAISNHTNECYYNLGYMYYRRGEMYSDLPDGDSAFADFTAALEHIEMSDSIHRTYIYYNRAQCYFDKSDYENSEADLLNALKSGYETLYDDISELLDVIHIQAKSKDTTQSANQD